MEKSIPVSLTTDELQELIEKACDFALLNGCGLRSKINYQNYAIEIAPFILFPLAFPRETYENACNLQIILNCLMHKVANDHEFLKTHLKNTIEADYFTRRLYKIYEIVYEEGFVQDITLTLMRSDLMVDKKDLVDTNCDPSEQFSSWKQVEINTFASGHGWLGPTCAKLHRFVLQQVGLFDKLKNIPENNALTGLCSGIIKAWTMYGNSSAIILFVVEKKPYNICDQRMHEFEITRLNPKIRVIRRTMEQLIFEAGLGPNKELVVNGFTVALVYYRSGYSPEQYSSGKEWDVRLLIERSRAIKCPSIQYHLAGTKKIQQVLSRPAILSKFLKDSDSMNRVKKICAGQYSLDFDEAGEAAVRMAIQNPNRFVLKPQREGGSHNLFGADVAKFLSSNRQKDERKAWILMDKICPEIQKNYMIRPNDETNMELKELTSELGIFGILISDSKKIYVNQQSGYTLRTKLASSNEGGVSSGFGALCSPFLV